ncbi:CrcB-like protein-domain-containing protein [Phaeosphaeriaceae sp. PMI808]|nr:CrcB-like protein-domain-containing protein [Phaeosphaeriaceae sp. PMI808]
MADHTNNNNNDNSNDHDTPPRRESHYNQQRSSLRSDRSSNPQPRSRQSGRTHPNDFDLEFKSVERADSDTLPSPRSAAPFLPYSRSRAGSNARSKGRGRAPTAVDELSITEPLPHPHDVSDPPPIPRAREQSRARGTASPPRDDRGNRSASQLDITALPIMTSNATQDSNLNPYSRSKPTPAARRASRLATELYTVSYLIFFAICGTLARLGLQALNFYPGAPVIFSELWANVAGTLIIGFFAEDRRFFRAEWGDYGEKLPEPSHLPIEDGERDKARHRKVKKTIPLYIGIATGFCGSFTSFSSFVRDIFLALANGLRSPISHAYPTNTPVPSTSSTASKNGGHSFMAICAVIIVTIGTCYSALKVGAHLALLLDPITPTLPFRVCRRIIDPVMVLLGWGMWLCAIILAIFPPLDAWRGQALFACVFAPVGCLSRYYMSVFLNPVLPSFPLGTFAVNIFGTAVLGMAYDLQRVPLRFSGVVGGSLLGCQALQGIMDGFCGALTTVSTWILEMDTLKNKHAYVYATTSVAVGLGLLTAIMGSAKWTVGWQDIVCIV